MHRHFLVQRSSTFYPGSCSTEVERSRPVRGSRTPCATSLVEQPFSLEPGNIGCNQSDFSHQFSCIRYEQLSQTGLSKEVD
jgi:hypothetical protein